MAHRLTREHVIWSFGPELEPVLEIEPGETVTFETNDCFTGQIRGEDDLVTEIDLERINSATGSVAVRGAEPGDSLVAEILDVRAADGRRRRCRDGRRHPLERPRRPPWRQPRRPPARQGRADLLPSASGGRH